MHTRTHTTNFNLFAFKISESYNSLREHLKECLCDHIHKVHFLLASLDKEEPHCHKYYIKVTKTFHQIATKITNRFTSLC